MGFWLSLSNLGFRTYAEYLESEHWKQFKQRYVQSDQPQRCRCCGLAKYELHHVTYKRLGQERLTDVIPLCRECHDKVHETLRTTRRGVEESTWAIHQICLKEGRPVGKLVRDLLVVPVPKKRKNKEEKYVPPPCEICGKHAARGETLCRPCRARVDDEWKKEPESAPVVKKPKWRPSPPPPRTEYDPRENFAAVALMGYQQKLGQTFAPVPHEDRPPIIRRGKGTRKAKKKLKKLHKAKK